MNHKIKITDGQIRKLEKELNAIMREEYAPLDGTYVCIDTTTMIVDNDYKTIQYNVRYGRMGADGRVIFQEEAIIDNPGGKWTKLVAGQFYEVLITLNHKVKVSGPTDGNE